MDTYGYAINLGQILEQSVADAFEGIILGTRKLEDVFIAMRDAIVGHFAQMIAKMIRQKLDFDTVWITNVENMPEQFGKSVFNIRNIWNSLMNWMTSSIGKLTGALGTIGYGIAGAVRGEPWRAMGGTVATVAMLTGHPVIAVATIATAEIARAIFKGRVEWVSVGAPAAGMAATRIGLEKTWWGVGLGMGWLESVSEFLFGWMGGLFRRKWPTIRGTAEISLKGLSDSLDYVEQYMEEIEKYLDEHTEIYAMYKTRFTRITIIEKRDVKGSMDKLAEAFGSFVDDLIDFYKSILPETMRFEELPDIRFTFGAGEKNMEKLAKQFVNELVSQTYNAWAIPIIEEYNKLLGINLFEKFGLPELGELPIEIGHDWNKEMKKLYRKLPLKPILNKSLYILYRFCNL